MLAHRPVDIRFDCLPLRSVGRLDIPLDASPRFRAKCERIKRALVNHGAHNTFYLHEGECVLRFSNHPTEGVVEFRFEGTVTTDGLDEKTIGADLDVQLRYDACRGLTEPVVAWLKDAVVRAVMLEFDHYVNYGGLSRTRERTAVVDHQWENASGFVGMGI